MILKDVVVEKDVVDSCPPMTAEKIIRSKKGFPEPPILSGTTAAPYVQPGELTLSQKDIAKLEWTNPVDPDEETVNNSCCRYDFEGNITEPHSSPDSYKSELHHHGSEPTRPGYSLEELFHLSQSGFQSQKSLAIKAVGCIAKNMSSQGRKTRREYHRLLIEEWKSHVRFSVACSDTSLNVRSAAWRSLVQLIADLDKECGCVASDLASIPEFFRAFNSEDESSVKVFLFIIQSLPTTKDDDMDEVYEIVTDAVLTAAEKFNLQPNEFVCGVKDTVSQIQSLVDTETCPAPEVVATLCDRIACISTEPLSVPDVELFEQILNNLHPSAPFYTSGDVDEFSWTARCNLVVQGLMEFNGEIRISLFLARFCFLFASSLFPLECRAAIWANSELLSNILRLVSSEGGNNLALLGNHASLDFTSGYVSSVTRDNAMVVRALRNSCVRFVEEHGDSVDAEIVRIANSVVTKLSHV
jgi:hypothetical protein